MSSWRVGPSNGVELNGAPSTVTSTIVLKAHSSGAVQVPTVSGSKYCASTPSATPSGVTRSVPAASAANDASRARASSRLSSGARGPSASTRRLSSPRPHAEATSNTAIATAPTARSMRMVLETTVAGGWFPWGRLGG